MCLIRLIKKLKFYGKKMDGTIDQAEIKSYLNFWNILSTSLGVMRFNSEKKHTVYELSAICGAL